MTNVKLSRDLASQGYSYAEMAAMTRRSELVRVRRGAYATPSDEPLDPRVAHRQLLEATVGQSSPESVVSHASAAVLHGLPIGTEQLARVHLTRDRPGNGKVRRYVQVHGMTLGPEEVVEVAGFRVTSLLRTVLDVSCAAPPLLAVPVGDAALWSGLRVDELAARIERAGPRRGLVQARRTLNLLDPRSESPGESMSRVVFAENGIIPPEPQLRVYDRAGRFVGRSDFGWKDQRVLGEFDGKKKYGEIVLRPGQSPEDALFEEKQREDRLRDLGWQVVRWIWADLYSPAQLLDRLHRAFTRGRRAAV